MSHFLNRLAARAVGRAPVARPRLPGRFEPAGGVAAGVVVTDAPTPTSTPGPAEPAARRVVPPAPEAGRSPIAEASRLAEALPATPARVEARSAPPAIELPPAPEAGPLPRAVAQPRLRRYTGEMPSSLEPGPAIAESAAIRPPPEGRAVLTVAGVPATDPRPALAEPSERAAPPAAAPSVVSATPPSRLDLSPPPAIEPPALELPGRLDDRAPGSPAPATPPVSRRSAEPAEPTGPTVKVTIGRIEVRAVTPPSSPARPRPRPAAAPPMPLADYLRRRGGTG